MREGPTLPRLDRAWPDEAVVRSSAMDHAHAEDDLRAGGRNFTVMPLPEGQEFLNPGRHLEVVLNRKQVFTNPLSATGSRRRVRNRSDRGQRIGRHLCANLRR